MTIKALWRNLKR